MTRIPALVVVGCLLALPALGQQGSTKKDSAPKAQAISIEELEKLLGKKDKLFLLDVRDAKEIEELGTVEGYVNIPVGQLEARLGEIPKDKLIITL